MSNTLTSPVNRSLEVDFPSITTPHYNSTLQSRYVPSRGDLFSVIVHFLVSLAPIAFAYIWGPLALYIAFVVSNVTNTGFATVFASRVPRISKDSNNASLLSFIFRLPVTTFYMIDSVSDPSGSTPLPTNGCIELNIYIIGFSPTSYSCLLPAAVVSRFSR